MCGLLFSGHNGLSLQMDRATLLFLIFACLTLATHGNNVTDCHAVKCAWMEEKICPGEFFQKEPSIGKCCPFCLVIVGESTLYISHRILPT